MYVCMYVNNLNVIVSGPLLGSITSHCSGNEPPLLPRISGRVDQTRESDGN